MARTNDGTHVPVTSSNMGSCDGSLDVEGTRYRASANFEVAATHAENIHMRKLRGLGRWLAVLQQQKDETQTLFKPC